MDHQLLTSNFGDAIVNVKAMYHIKHLAYHDEDIAKSDIVLISCGVNDIVQWKANGNEVAECLIERINSLQVKFPNIRFLFSAINPTNIDCPLNEAYIRHIDMINLRIFKYSLTSRNMKLFDNMHFEWRHLTPDGIHITHTGRKCMSMSWILAIRKSIGLEADGLLPIRPQYRDIYKNFISSNSKW